MGSIALILALWAGFAPEQPEPADVIMAKVATNQDRAQHMRSAFVYHQSMLIRFMRAHGKIAREEQRDYTVTPGAKGFKKELTHFTGKYAKSGQLIEYNEPGYQYKGVDIDGELADSLANDMANDQHSRDGITNDVAYGGEFYVRGLFLYKRTIALSVVNSGFQKADVTTTVSFDPLVASH